MPWIIGIDEAGYGPNLGPLVMTSVACRVPEELLEADLWKVLRRAVRRSASPDDGRLFIDDSKLVYSPTRGLHGLETGVLGTLSPWHTEETVTLKQFLSWLSPADACELDGEPWYSGATQVPVMVEQGELTKARARFARACEKQQVRWGLVRSAIICPTRFNAFLDRWGSKGAILGYGLEQLLQYAQRPDEGDEPVFVFIDKHGGRNDYFAILQNALPDGLVVAQEESTARSVYRLLGAKREMKLTILPRADGEHLCVALASMVSKYVRELLMTEFNEFWQKQVPELKGTAGYPGDAARFYDAIRPAVLRLGIPEPSLWRRK